MESRKKIRWMPLIISIPIGIWQVILLYISADLRRLISDYSPDSQYAETYSSYLWVVLLLVLITLVICFTLMIKRLPDIIEFVLIAGLFVITGYTTIEMINDAYGVIFEAGETN